MIKAYVKLFLYKETKTFVVQEIVSSIQGFLPLTSDPFNNKAKIFSALKTGNTIPLICIKTIEGKPVYSANLHALDAKQEDNSVSISISFSPNDESFNSSVFDTMFNLLGDIIDNDFKFSLAKQLIVANKELRIRPSLYKEISINALGNMVCNYGRKIYYHLPQILLYLTFGKMGTILSVNRFLRN